MAIPNHTTAAAAIYARLNTDLVSTHASSVWRAAAPQGQLPAEADRPMVVFEIDADYGDTTFADNIAGIAVQVWVVAHTAAARSQSDTVVGRVIGDGSTYGLDRWKPTVTGIGTTPLRLVSSGEGQYDTDHIAHVMRFETWLSEG